MKRQRGRNRRPGGGGGGGHHQQHNNNPNRTLESNGPDVKVRGPAAVIYERYLQLARDAASSGDRVLSENYLQHADHYFRLVRSMQPAQPVLQQQTERFNDGDIEGDEEGRDEGERAEVQPVTGEGEDQAESDFQQERPQQGFDREGGRRGRGRRNRFRPEGVSEGAEAREGGEERGERPERAERPERQFSDRGEGDSRRERRPRREDESREGFSDGPKPAFLRTGGDD